MKKRVGIIGAGASGLVCAIMGARKGHQVVVFEKNNIAGKKILATGNGRCNLTNSSLQIDNYHGENPEFTNYLLKNFDFLECKKFFLSLGLEIVKGKKTKHYPMSLHGSSVVDLLYFQCEALGVKFVFNCEIDEVKKKDTFEILERKFDAVVLACGGESGKKLGGTVKGYELARVLGHSLQPTFPTLVQLLTKERDFFVSSGVRIEGEVKSYINRVFTKSVLGDLLFTKYGLSGNTILDLSRDCVQGLDMGSEVTIVVDMFPHLKRDELLQKLFLGIKHGAGKTLLLFLEGFVNKKLIPPILHLSHVGAKNALDLTRKDLNKITHTLKNLKFTITGSKGFDYGEVAAGGVMTKEIDPKTFQSKKMKGLYIVGELLDIDGDCGGYNLHFAWGSGYLAGKSI